MGADRVGIVERVRERGRERVVAAGPGGATGSTRAASGAGAAPGHDATGVRASGGAGAPRVRVRGAALLGGLALALAGGRGSAIAAAPAPPIAPGRLPIPLDAEAWKKLEEGGTIVEGRTVEGQRLQSMLALFVIEAPLERVLAVITDSENAEEFMPYVVESEARPGEGGTVLNTQRLDLPWPAPDLTYEIEIRKQPPAGDDPAEPWQVHWKYVPGSGNIAENRGTWSLFRHGEQGTLVVYDNFVDPGGWVPGWLQDWASRRAIPDVAEAVRARTLATGD